ncbi:MAG: hypothetical protein D3923_00545 [Candidatus Electrothrix sp. AR3]|nr:hypothetical protein [Candidatus Electrothrix sp. AR3]
MKFFFTRFNSRFLFEIFFIFMVGILIAQGVLQTSEMEGKWTKLLMMGILGATGLLVIPDREKFLLYFAAFLLPINLSMHVGGYNTVPFFREINGLPIRAVDFPLALILISWVMRLLKTKSKIKLHPWMTIPYLVLLISCIASWNGRTVHPIVKTGALVLIIKNLLLFLYLSNTLKNQRTIFILIGIFLLNGSLQSCLAIAQYAKGGPIGLQMLGETDIVSTAAGMTTVTRVGGTIGHPNKLALFLAFMIEINIALFFVPASKIIKILRVVPMLLMSSAILLTYSRSSWASIFLGGSISIYWCRTKKTKQRLMSAILVVSIMGGIAVTAIGGIPSVRNRIFEDDRGTGDIRIPLKVICWNIIRHNYWLGVGLNNYASVIHKYDNSEMGASWHFPMPVHNEYMLMAAELGVPAAIVFIMLIGFIVIRHISIGLTDINMSYSCVTIGFLCGWIGWILHHRTLFEYALFSHNIWFYLGIVQAIKNNISSSEIERKDEQL